MFEVQILIPTKSNEKVFFSAEHHAAFETFASNLFGGITRLPSAAAGAWVDGGKLYQDTTLVYVVAVPSITRGADVAALVEFVKAHYAQLAVYIRYLGLSEIL